MIYSFNYAVEYSGIVRDPGIKGYFVLESRDEQNCSKQETLVPVYQYYTIPSSACMCRASPQTDEEPGKPCMIVWTPIIIPQAIVRCDANSMPLMALLDEDRYNNQVEFKWRWQVGYCIWIQGVIA